jgi:hypothetical protein
MESPANPYSTPATNLYGSTSGGAVETVAASTIAQLAGTKPWIRFLSVILWIASGFLALGSCIYALIAAAGPSMFANNPVFANNPAFKNNPLFANSPAFMTGLMIGTAVYFGVFAFLTIYPALKLWKYANRIATLMATRAIVDLDAALTEQRRYWKFNGILTIIGICMFVIGVIAFFALIVTAAQSGMKVPR